FLARTSPAWVAIVQLKKIPIAIRKEKLKNLFRYKFTKNAVPLNRVFIKAFEKLFALEDFVEGISSCAEREYFAYCIIISFVNTIIISVFCISQLIIVHAEQSANAFYLG